MFAHLLTIEAGSTRLEVRLTRFSAAADGAISLAVCLRGVPPSAAVPVHAMESRREKTQRDGVVSGKSLLAAIG